MDGHTDTIILMEPRGSTFRDLVGSALVYCNRFMFVVRKREHLNEQGRDLLTHLSEWLVDQTSVDEWPGTRTNSDSRLLVPGDRAVAFQYRLCEGSADILTRSSPALYDWVHPSLPEDICFIRPSNAIWLASVTVDRFAYLTVAAAERRSIESRIPGLRLGTLAEWQATTCEYWSSALLDQSTTMDHRQRAVSEIGAILRNAGSLHRGFAALSAVGGDTNEDEELSSYCGAELACLAVDAFERDTLDVIQPIARLAAIGLIRGGNFALGEPSSPLSDDHDQDQFEAHVSMAMSEHADDAVLQSCGEALARMWLQRIERDLLGRLTPSARVEAEDVLRVRL